MLRLVKPPTEGEGARPSRGRRRVTIYSLTSDESRHLRTALQNLRWAYGSWSCLAAVMDVSAKVLSLVASGRRPGSPGLALRAAQAAGMHVETLLTGTLTSAGRCPTCGSRVGHHAAPVASAR